MVDVYNNNANKDNKLSSPASLSFSYGVLSQGCNSCDRSEKCSRPYVWCYWDTFWTSIYRTDNDMHFVDEQQGVCLTRHTIIGT